MATTVTFPTRFRAAEQRNARLARVLKRLGRVDEIDETLMHRIGSALLERDEPGARLARAMRLPAGDPERVTMAGFRAALDAGGVLDPGAPAALGEFFARVDPEPEWLDRDLLDRGCRVFRGFGRNAADVLLQLSLIGGYRFGGPPDLLVATGALAGAGTRRRLAETQAWTVAVTTPGGLDRGAEGWRTTLHVRAMHALVNLTFEPRWDVARWGLPINQADQAGTLGLFDGTLLIGVKALGVPVSAGDSRAVMHLWRYVGWLLGLGDAWLVDDERERHRLNYHILLAQDGLTEAGPRLSQDIVAVLGELPHGRWRTERNLSMLSLFLGHRSMVELGLPWRPPWAHAGLWASNTVRYRVGGALPGGAARIERRGAAEAQRLLAEYYGSTVRDLADLPG